MPELYLKSIDLKVSEGRSGSVHFLKKVLLEKLRTTTLGKHFGNFTKIVQNVDRLMVFSFSFFSPVSLLWVNFGRFCIAKSL